MLIELNLVIIRSCSTITSITIFVALINYFVTFKVLGKNYEAAVMSAGMCGIAIGSTQTL